MKNTYSRKGFSLVEMLVVIGIIAALLAASLAAYIKLMRAADRARCQELVVNTATAFALYFQTEGAWPKQIRDAARETGLVDENVAYCLARPPSDRDQPYMSLSLSKDKKKLVSYDRFGIISPWAVQILKQKGNECTLETSVNGRGTVFDHLLHFAIDYDGDGIIESVDVGGETIDIRATAVCWCAGYDGKLEKYSVGIRKDDCYSWTKGQTRGIVK